MTTERAMRTIRVRKTATVEEVTILEVEIPADYDLSEWMENDLIGFAVHVDLNSSLVDEFDGEVVEVQFEIEGD